MRNDLPPLEREAERIGGWLNRALNAMGRIIELPANIAEHRGSGWVWLARLVCWVSVLFFPLLPLWLVALAWASSLKDREG
ncbi:MAG: hypothetical protein WD009_00945 [Phycisphaeraceae bacterium]